MTRRRAPAARADPLRPAQLFRHLARRRGLVLAVSGGADSTALMVLVARWRKRPPVLVVAVDHGLRDEAAAEAAQVAANAATLGLPCKIAKVETKRASGNLQDWARRARYGLLVSAAEEAGFDTIVTAHHRDDQAETFMLRLARGSGVYGLAAMPEETTLDGILLARPLLAVSRDALRKVASASRLAISEDPSNADLRFDRVRLRAAMPQLEKLGLDVERLAQTATHLRRAASALDHYAGLLLKDSFVADAFGVVSGDAAELGEAPEEVGLRALALILKAVSGADYTPRLDAVAGLRAALLAAGEAGKIRRTLSGVVVSVAGGQLSARREWGRTGLADAAAPAGATLLWDRRFEIGVPALKGPLSVGALARSERRLRAPAERGAIDTLPGLYRNGTLVAVPPAVSAADEGAPLAALPVVCVVGRRLGLPPKSAAIGA